MQKDLRDALAEVLVLPRGKTIENPTQAHDLVFSLIDLANGNHASGNQLNVQLDALKFLFEQAGSMTAESRAKYKAEEVARPDPRTL